MSDHIRLAHAVLKGDWQAALVLADLIQEQYGHLERPAIKEYPFELWTAQLYVRTRKALRRKHVDSFAALLALTCEDLLEAKNFGEMSLKQLRHRLADLGLHLSGDNLADLGLRIMPVPEATGEAIVGQDDPSPASGGDLASETTPGNPEGM